MGSSRRATDGRRLRWRCVVVVVLAVTLTAAGPFPAGVATTSGALPSPWTSSERPAPGASASGWLWPLRPDPAVVADFAAPAVPWAAGHRGVDLAAAAGQQVRAPAGGTVTFTGTVVGRGVLTITHTGGLRSSVEPVHGVAVAGDVVAAGDLVAVVATTSGHCAPRTCLHWGVRRGDVYVDPLRLLGPADPPVLLPLRPSPG